jgi:hypothetical protein
LNETGGNISKFIGIRSQIEMPNEDGKGFAYTVLSQLYPKSQGINVLIKKSNQPTYYRNHIGLQAYVIEMCNEVRNKYGSLCKYGDTCIGERGILFIPKMYDKLLIVFFSGKRNREIKLYFPDMRIPPFCFDINNYDETLNQQIPNLEREIVGVGNHFTDSFYQQIINIFNNFNN